MVSIELQMDNHWVQGPLFPTPEQITASLWSDLKELKDAVSMSGKDGSRQKSFIHEIGQGTVSFTDQEFTMLKRFVERRGRDAAHVTIAPVNTAQYCSPRSPSPETQFDARVYLEENEEGKMDPERDQLESPSASTSFETSGQQCHPNWETRRTTAAGCLPAGVGSNMGRNTFSPTERVISVHHNGGFLPGIILSTQCCYHRGTRLNATKRFIFAAYDPT